MALALQGLGPLPPASPQVPDYGRSTKEAADLGPLLDDPHRASAGSAGRNLPMQCFGCLLPVLLSYVAAAAEALALCRLRHTSPPSCIPGLQLACRCMKLELVSRWLPYFSAVEQCNSI